MDCAYFGIRSEKPLRKASVATSKNNFDKHSQNHSESLRIAFECSMLVVWEVLEI